MRLRTTPSRLIPASCFVPHKPAVIESAVIELWKFADRRQPRLSPDLDLAPTLDIGFRSEWFRPQRSQFRKHHLEIGRLLRVLTTGTLS